jgi:hypothetical protein
VNTINFKYNLPLEQTMAFESVHHDAEQLHLSEKKRIWYAVGSKNSFAAASGYPRRKPFMDRHYGITSKLHVGNSGFRMLISARLIRARFFGNTGEVCGSMCLQSASS